MTLAAKDAETGIRLAEHTIQSLQQNWFRYSPKPVTAPRTKRVFGLQRLTMTRYGPARASRRGGRVASQDGIDNRLERAEHGSGTRRTAGEGRRCWLSEGFEDGLGRVTEQV